MHLPATPAIPNYLYPTCKFTSHLSPLFNIFLASLLATPRLLSCGMLKKSNKAQTTICTHPEQLGMKKRTKSQKNDNNYFLHPGVQLSTFITRASTPSTPYTLTSTPAFPPPTLPTPFLHSRLTCPLPSP